VQNLEVLQQHLLIWIDMPVSFLSSAQCDNYAKYPTDLPSDIVDSLFFLMIRIWSGLQTSVVTLVG
jgi:hypothetical protein